MVVLGIETSCDETAVAILDSKQGLLSNIIHTQVDLHAKYGGIVPELASRDHVNNIAEVTSWAIKDADLQWQDIEAIAYTRGPGLAGALLVGSLFAQSLALSLEIPTIGVHHLEAHLLAPFLDNPDIQFPFIALLISGGHTQLILAKDIGEYKILGQSRDDAVGEAFDKVAKMMSLRYPGGVEIEKLATQSKKNHEFVFPVPLAKSADMDFSFSGIKTYAMRLIKNSQESMYADIADAFQLSVATSLALKSKKALNQYGINTLLVSGGVAANSYIRSYLSNSLTGVDIIYPRKNLCTDNGAMIAYAGWQHLDRGRKDENYQDIVPRWSLENLYG